MQPKREKLIVLSETASTNKYAMQLVETDEATDGLAIFAVHQTQGRGRREKEWLSQPGENVILSVIIKADGLSARHLFPLSMATSLATYRVIHENVNADVKIKWPNDIYINDKKAAGILIENVFTAAKWQWSVVGIGINVNQTGFPPFAKRATSLCAVSGQTYDVLQLAHLLHKKVLQQVERVRLGVLDPLLKEYNTLLFGKDRTVKIKAGGKVFETVIRKVTKEGLLVTEDVLEREFGLDEVEFREIVI